MALQRALHLLWRGKARLRLLLTYLVEIDACERCVGDLLPLVFNPSKRCTEQAERFTCARGGLKQCIGARVQGRQHLRYVIDLA